MPQSKFQFPFLVPVAALAAVAACGLFPSVASAQPIFSDNFDAETPGLTVTSLTNWTISRGNVDVLGPGSGFDFYPGNGRYIDLDGTASGNINGAALMTTKTAFNLDPGNYTLSFSLGKNGSASESMMVSVGSSFSQTISDSLNYPALVPLTYNFTVTGSGATGAISFNHAGNDNQGYIIDNVSLVRTVTGGATAPEPGSLSLLATLPVAFGMLRLRRRRK